MIGCAFGRLTAQWRILLRTMEIPIEKLSNIIKLVMCFIIFAKKLKVKQTQILQKILYKKKERRAKLGVDKLNSYTSLDRRKVREAIKSTLRHICNFLLQKLTTQSLSDILYQNLVPRGFQLLDTRTTAKDNGEKCLSLLFLYRKEKKPLERDYLYRCSFEAAKAAIGGVLKFQARSLKNMLERVHC